jgi:ketosteroid isomerase-like protein
VIQHESEIVPFDSSDRSSDFATSQWKGESMTISLFTSLSGTMAAIAAASAVAMPTKALAADPLRSVQQSYATGNAALMRGDAKGWQSNVPLTDDFVLFAPFGGKPSRAADYSQERVERMGRFFKGGDFREEVVQTFVSDSMIVLATIERTNASVGGLPGQEWALRVTSVFKREGDRWKLAHRHADPFVEEVSVSEAARIARGERQRQAK